MDDTEKVIPHTICDNCKDYGEDWEINVDGELVCACFDCPKFGFREDCGGERS